MNTGFCSLGGNDLRILFEIVGVDGVLNGLEANWAPILSECIMKYQNGQVSGGWVEWLVDVLNG